MYSFFWHLLSLLSPFHKNIVSSVPLRDGRLLPGREHFLEKNVKKLFLSHHHVKWTLFFLMGRSRNRIKLNI